MIETADPTTLQLAMLLGAAMLAAGIGGLRMPAGWTRLFDELDASPGLALTLGLVAIILGGLVLLLPGGWSDPLACIVSGIGLVSLAEGLVLLAAPDLYLRFARPLLRHARIWAIAAIVSGTLLFLAGLLGRTF